MRTFIFIHEKFSENDLDLFFGPIEDEEIVRFNDEWTMAHIVHCVGLFSSITRARKNNWDKPIDHGFTLRVKLGRKNMFKFDISILNTFTDD